MWMSLFAVGMRNCNGAAMVEQLCHLFTECSPPMVASVYSGKLKGREGVMVWCCYMTVVFVLFGEIGQQSKNASARASICEAFTVTGKEVVKLDCTAARFAELLPLLIDLSADEDIAVVAGAMSAVHLPLFTSNTACADLVMSSQELHAAVLSVMRRASGGQLRRPASWWKERD